MYCHFIGKHNYYNLLKEKTQVVPVGSIAYTYIYSIFILILIKI